jgi:hypothetical protein
VLCERLGLEKVKRLSRMAGPIQVKRLFDLLGPRK